MTPYRDLKQPAYLWYPKDWDSDELVKSLTYEQQGIYRKLLDHQWLEGSIPKNVIQIATVLGFRNGDIERFSNEVWPALASKFVAQRRTKDRLVNKRLEVVRQERAEFLKKAAKFGKKGARSRWGKKR